jgi:Rad3-related DNA helicase
VNNINPGAVAAAAGFDRDFVGKQSPSGNGSQRATRGPELRPYRRAVIARVAAEACRRLLLVAPTGSGKTVIAAAIIKAAVERGERAVVLTNRRELTKEDSQKLHAVGIDHGIVQASFPTRPGARPGRLDPNALSRGRPARQHVRIDDRGFDCRGSDRRGVSGPDKRAPK